MRQTIMITGASRGIGAAIARLLGSRPGYRLILVCRNNTPQLAKVMDQIRFYHPNSELYPVACDLSSPEAIRMMFDDVCAHFGAPDVLINNAGIAHIGLLQDMKEAEVLKLIAADLSAAILLSRLCIPHMLHQMHEIPPMVRSEEELPDPAIFRSHCAILNISSVWGNCGAACEAVYSAAKGGINSFTRALAKELAPSAIPVNALACGMVATDMNASLTKEDQDAICEQIPAGRIARPEEIAAMVDLILQSPSYMTGQVITMDGGWT